MEINFPRERVQEFWRVYARFRTEKVKERGILEEDMSILIILLVDLLQVMGNVGVRER